MIWSQDRLSQSAQLFFPVCRRAMPLLLPASLMIWGIEYGASSVHKLRFDAPYETSMTLIIASGVAAFFGNLLLGALWAVVSTWATVWALRGKLHPPSLVTDYHQTLIEHVRRLLSTMLWALAFIVPGIFRWVRLTFTPHVALLHQPYREGRVDALQKSSELVRSHGLALGALLLVQVIVLASLEALGTHWGPFAPAIVIFYTLSWGFGVFSAIYLTLTYLVLDKQDV